MLSVRLFSVVHHITIVRRIITLEREVEVVAWTGEGRGRSPGEGECLHPPVTREEGETTVLL